MPEAKCASHAPWALEWSRAPADPRRARVRYHARVISDPRLHFLSAENRGFHQQDSAHDGHTQIAARGPTFADPLVGPLGWCSYCPMRMAASIAVMLPKLT